VILRILTFATILIKFWGHFQMKLQKIRLYNYKGFKDSGWIELSPNFTVVVGKNNSGKSAFLEGFRLQRSGNKPHLSIGIVRGGHVDPISRIHVVGHFHWHEIQINAQYVGNQIYYPLTASHRNELNAQNWEDIIVRPSMTLELQSRTDVPYVVATRWPSHGRFEDSPNSRICALLNHDATKAEWSFGGIAENEENLPRIADEALRRQVYNFSAERLNIDQSMPQADQSLSPNASNLPTVLHELSTNPNLWKEYNNHVCQIFPEITAITTPPVENSQTITIKVWHVPVESNRADLAIRLTDCGTGVGQVLAILYVAMTRQQNVIVIDEPNSFLHPGAARKLIEILKQYDTNQYVVSTHSPELISAINPDIIHRVHWDVEGGQSKVEQMNGASIDDMALLLDDLGAKLSDVFGADYVIWVEGQTEEACFPTIAASCDEPPPLGTLFVRVRATGDFESKKSDANLVWDIYERLSGGAALVPPALAFSFDREGRSEQQLSDMEKKSGGMVKFLPRCLVENYFLHSAAIAFAIDHEMTVRDVDAERPGISLVDEKIASLAGRHGVRDVTKDWQDDGLWLRDSNGAILLKALFAEFDLTYNKIQHGRILTEWLVANHPEHLTELSAYVAGLWRR
jgi:predicted ATPase